MKYSFSTARKELTDVIVDVPHERSHRPYAPLISHVYVIANNLRRKFSTSHRFAVMGY